MASTELSAELLEMIFPRHDPSPCLPFVGPLGTGAGDEGRTTHEEFAGIAKSFTDRT